jgi:MFS family permease
MPDHIRKKSLLATYIMTIFFALHYTVPYFILSKFLSVYFDTGYISLIFIFSGATSIMMGNYLGYFLKRYKDYKTLLSLCLAQVIVTTLIPFLGSISLLSLIIAFAAHVVLAGMIWSCISIFLEEFSPTDNVGAIRGLSLTIFNFGAVISPFLAANVFNAFDYFGIFILSALSLLPIIFFAREYLSHIKEPSFKHKSLFKALKKIKGNPDLKGVFISSFMLNAFYAVTNVYLVLYILNTVHISTALYLGVITPIFLLPFILIPFELGKISDEYFGEKRFMIFGILIFSLVLMSIYLFDVKTDNIFIWAIILFISRVGATMNETENYTYFYKKINAENADLIAIFHNMVNISLIAISILGFTLVDLFGLTIPTLLFVVGLLGLASIFKILQIHDTEAKRKLAPNLEEIEDLNL